jgi:hypothetical protein
MSAASTVSTATAAAAAPAVTPYIHQLDDDHPSVPFHFLTKEPAIRKIITTVMDATGEKGLIKDVARIVAEYVFTCPCTEPSSVPNGCVYYGLQEFWNLFQIRLPQIDIPEELSTSGITDRIIASLSPTVLIPNGNEGWKEVPLTAGLVMERAVKAGKTKWSDWSWERSIEVLKNLPVTEACPIALGKWLLPRSWNQDEKAIKKMIAEQGAGKDEPSPPAPETAIVMIVHYCATNEELFNRDENGLVGQRCVLTSLKIDGWLVSLGFIFEGSGLGLYVDRNYGNYGAGVLQKLRPVAN